MQSSEGRTSLLLEIGGCTISIEGPLDSALPLLEYLRAFRPAAPSGYPNGFASEPKPLAGPRALRV